MKRVKKPKKKNQKRNVSEKQLQRIKNKVTDDVTKDEIGLTDDQVCAIFKRANLYGGYLDEHLVKIKLVQETVEKGTGIKFKGW